MNAENTAIKRNFNDDFFVVLTLLLWKSLKTAIFRGNFENYFSEMPLILQHVISLLFVKFYSKLFSAGSHIK